MYISLVAIYGLAYSIFMILGSSKSTYRLILLMLCNTLIAFAIWIVHKNVVFIESYNNAPWYMSMFIVQLLALVFIFNYVHLQYALPWLFRSWHSKYVEKIIAGSLSFALINLFGLFAMSFTINIK